MIIPYKYYYYGSSDSIDKVLIELPSNVFPNTQEQRKLFLKQLELKYNLNWNTNIIIINNGYISDTIYPKSWIDSLNNAFYTTYNNHKQIYELPIKGLVKRNKLLAIYKTVRTVLCLLSRTNYRNIIKPILNGCHDFNLKLNALNKIRFNNIISFNQKNTSDIDIWKIISFYLGQNISLIQDNIEIYSKQDLIIHHPKLYNFIYRKNINNTDIDYLNDYLKQYISIINNYGTYISKNNYLYCHDEIIDMKKEIY